MTSPILTTGANKRIVAPIGANKSPWGRRNSLFTTASRHVSCGYFCARNSGASRLGREGGEYNTLRGNKPACLVTGFEPPATSAVVESLIGGVVQRYHEGDVMTEQTHPDSILITNNAFAPRYMAGERICVIPENNAPNYTYRAVLSENGRLWIGKKDQVAPFNGEAFSVTGRVSQ